MTDMIEITEMRRSESTAQSFRRLPRSGEEFSDNDGPDRNEFRNGRWWYATYHNITAIVGSGVLGLPTAMAYLGWQAGVPILVMSWVITLYTLWQMLQMYELQGADGKIEVYKTYYELGERAFGERLGKIVVAQQLIVFVGVDIVYMLTGGQSFSLFYRLVSCKDIDHCCGYVGEFTVLFAGLQLVLAQLNGFNSIAFISFAASVMAFCYCTIAWVISSSQGKTNHAPYGQLSPFQQANCTTSYVLSGAEGRPWGAFGALGVIAFAYGGHNVVLEIQHTLPSSKEKPSKHQMWWGVLIAYFVVALCYFPVAFVGYWALGNHLTLATTSKEKQSNGSILIQLYRHQHRGSIAAANFMVFIHVTGSYLVYAMPAFDIMHKTLVEKYQIQNFIKNLIRKFRSQEPTRDGSTMTTQIVARSFYVCFTAFVALTFPFFEDLLEFFGGFAITPTTYFVRRRLTLPPNLEFKVCFPLEICNSRFCLAEFCCLIIEGSFVQMMCQMDFSLQLPCIIWLILKKPKVFAIDWVINWCCILIGLSLTVIGTIAAMVNIVKAASGYKFYSSFGCGNLISTDNSQLQCTRLYFTNR